MTVVCPPSGSPELRHPRGRLRPVSFPIATPATVFTACLLLLVLPAVSFLSATPATHHPAAAARAARRLGAFVLVVSLLYGFNPAHKMYETPIRGRRCLFLNLLKMSETLRTVGG